VDQDKDEVVIVKTLVTQFLCCDQELARIFVDTVDQLGVVMEGSIDEMSHVTKDIV